MNRTDVARLDSKSTSRNARTTGELSFGSVALNVTSFSGTPDQRVKKALKLSTGKRRKTLNAKISGVRH
jgi:hypothetical protein